MHAIGFKKPLPITEADSLSDIELAQPVATEHDLLVEVKAISVNPVDTKIRTNAQPKEGEYRILGWDASGVVKSVGSAVSLFKPGDEVFYAGDLTRPGSNAEYQLVDERIVGHKPKTLSHEQAAAVPLTAITAWELLFDRLRVPYGVKSQQGCLLILNGAGGVGSMLIQLAKRLTGLTVIATASRPETIEWVNKLGADYVINHHQPINDQIRKLGIQQVEYVAGLTATANNLEALLDIIAPQGTLALIDDPKSFDITRFKSKSVTIVWEFMFTRSMYRTADMIAQHQLLNEVSHLLDAGILVSTLTQNAGAINAANLQKVHKLIESGQAIGKIVLSGFKR